MSRRRTVQAKQPVKEIRKVEKWHVREYSVAEFIKEGTTPVETGVHAGKTYWGDYSNNDNPDSEFLGFGNPRAAAEAANFGWPQGTELVNQMRAKISHRLGIKNRQLVTCQDVMGGMVDVPLFLSGVPDCMVSFEESETSQVGFVHVHISTGVGASVSTRDIQLQGAMVGALIDALESCNHRVKLTWERSSRSYDQVTQGITLWMVLKDYQESLDLDRLTFFLCNNAARRGIAWTNYLKSPEGVRTGNGIDIGPGHATCFPCSNPDLFAGADVTIRHMDVREEDCADWIIKEMERIGVAIDKAE
jgi:hypothetical protein